MYVAYQVCRLIELSAVIGIRDCTCQQLELCKLNHQRCRTGRASLTMGESCDQVCYYRKYANTEA